MAAGDFRDSELYRESLRRGLISNAAQQAQPIPEDAERREAMYQLSGLWCASCGWVIEHALRRERGIVSAEVMFASDLLKVTFCPQFVPTGQIEKCVESFGYRAELYTGGKKSADKDQRDLLLRLGIAAGLWMNVMLFSLVVYASYFEGISAWAQRMIPVILMALATPAIFYSGWPILRIGWLGLRHGTIRMESLISTGVLAAYGYSIAQIFRGGRHFYFDTACAIVTLVLSGKALERGAKNRTAQALSVLHRMIPKKARVLLSGQERFVSVDAIEPGMMLLVKAGERIPADGVIASGRSFIDESVITGESRPCAKAQGDSTIGGSLNGAGVLEIQVIRRVEESTLSQIVRSVEATLAAKTTTERMVDRISRIFVPAVLAIAIATFLGCRAFGTGDVEALMRAIAVLVIACPCALGIATPLATTAAVGAASRDGILLRDPGVLEAIRKLDVVILDKTGTATEGCFRVHEACWNVPDSAPLIAALESRSEHPIGQAIQAIASATGCIGDVNVHRGLGISGIVDGRSVVAGNFRFMQQENVALDSETLIQASLWEREGFTVVFCAVDGAMAGAIALGDQVRAGARELVSALASEGIRVLLVSGDSSTVTAAVAARLGVRDFEAEALPQRKSDIVSGLRAQGNVVAMAGDGINDAPALAMADLGIAVGSATDIARHAAPVVVMGDSLMKISWMLQLARHTNHIIRMNLLWAFAYNVAGIGLAATGTLNPILAAAAMVLSSSCVIANSMRVDRPSERRDDPNPEPIAEAAPRVS
jgi:heavy metal translocating P-type ATPase